MNADRETTKIKDAIKDINTHLTAAGVKGVSLRYIDTGEMLSSQFNQKTGLIVHNIECKRLPQMTGRPVETLGHIFVHCAMDDFLTKASRDYTRIDDHNFFTHPNVDESAFESINQSMVDELLAPDDGVNYVLYLDQRP